VRECIDTLQHVGREAVLHAEGRECMTGFASDRFQGELEFSGFHGSLPVTLAFARKVGQVLAEMLPPVAPREEFRFYM